MSRTNKRNSDAERLAHTMTEPEATASTVVLWNCGQAIDRNTTRCGNLMLSVNVQAKAGEIEGREENSNRDVRLRPGLNSVDAGYWARCMADVEREKARAEKANRPAAGVAKWLHDGELVFVESVDGLNARDAKAAIEGSSDLSFVLEIANAGGPHADIARDHLDRVTDGGSAILGHFASHDRN